MRQAGLGWQRRWMPQNPCCCRKEAACLDTCCRVTLSGVDYSTEVGNETPPIWVTDHEWELPAGTSPIPYYFDCYWSRFISDEISQDCIVQEGVLTVRYRVLRYHVGDVYTLTLTITINFSGTSGYARIIVFSKDYDEDPIGPDSAIRLGTTRVLDFVSDTPPSPYPDYGGASVVGPPDFSGATATLVFGKKTDCDDPFPCDLYFPYCPPGEAPWGFEINISGEWAGAALNETFIINGLDGQAAGMLGSWRYRRSYGQVGDIHPAFNSPRMALSTDLVGNTNWYLMMYAGSMWDGAPFSYGEGVVSQGCDITGTHTLENWTPNYWWLDYYPEVEDWVITVTPVGEFDIPRSFSMLKGKSSLAAKGGLPVYTWAELIGKSSLAAVGGTTNLASGHVTGKSSLNAIGGTTNLASAHVTGKSSLNAIGGPPPE